MAVSDRDKRPLEIEMGAATLAACIVQTMNESDSTFQERFLKRLEAAYYELRDNPNAVTGTGSLEMLEWTRDLLTGFDRVRGQGEPFLSDNTVK